MSGVGFELSWYRSLFLYIYVLQYVHVYILQWYLPMRLTLELEV